MWKNNGETSLIRKAKWQVYRGFIVTEKRLYISNSMRKNK
jgi:hypothetical protein